MIKNLGGVFGRNPTFNNVEVEGDLTVDGSIIGTVAAGGSNTQVQFNNAGVLDANAGLTYDSATENLRVRSHATRYFTIGANAAGASEILGYGNRPLSINSVENTIDIGDVYVIANGTAIQIDDPNASLNINCPNGTITVDSPTVILTQGSLDLGESAIITSSSATSKAIRSTVPAGTGVTPTIQIICPSSAFTLQSQTATQAVFPIPQDTITLQASTTYMFDGQYILQSGTVSHFTSMSFVLTTATVTNMTWFVLATAGNGAGSQSTSQTTTYYNSASGGQVIGSSTNSHTIIKFEGVLRVNVGGTMVPNIKFSTAPGVTCSTLIGSYLKFYPIGSNTISSVGTAIG